MNHQLSLLKSFESILLQLKNIETKRLIAYMVILLSILVTLTELGLLEIKYEVFRGGFLQSHSIQTVGSSILFVFSLLALTLVFFWSLQMLFFSCLSKLITQPLILVYHFVWLVGGSVFVSIGFNYELGKYFSDFLDYQVVKNLGGGPFTNALHYILEEGLVYVLGLLALLSVFILGHFFIHHRYKPAKVNNRFNRLSAGWFLFAFALQAVLIILINHNSVFRYNLNRTIAYSASRALLDWLTDIDRDGYGLFAWQKDPEPFDSTIYPLALDIPNDGIDQDGIGGDFKVSGAVTNDQLIPSNFTANLNVVLIVLESARADALEHTILGRPVMPRLSLIAQEGSSGKAFFSHAGYTVSSLTALFSGQLTPSTQLQNSILKPFKQLGYEVAIFSGQDESFGNINVQTGMKQYASVYFDAEMAKEDRVFPSASQASLTLSNDRVADEVIRSGVINRDKPFFMYINLQAGHFPYFHPRMPLILMQEPLARADIKAKNHSRLLETYYNAMAYDDEVLGRIVAELKQKGVYERTVLVVCGDHGESLFDDGFLGHGHYINDVQMRTLLVSNKILPGMNEPMGQIDLRWAILSLFSADYAKAPKRIDGVFHFIGGLSQPALIGMTYKDGTRVILNLETLEAQTSANKQDWLSNDTWLENPSLKARIEQLVIYWESLRWQESLSSQSNK